MEKAYFLCHRPNELAICKHIHRPYLMVAIVPEHITVLLALEKLFEHHVGGGFESAAPLVETLRDLAIL